MGKCAKADLKLLNVKYRVNTSNSYYLIYACVENEIKVNFFCRILKPIHNFSIPYISMNSLKMPPIYNSK